MSNSAIPILATCTRNSLDGDEYDVECTQFTAILDAVELNNVELQVKHCITSLASTIMNMTFCKPCDTSKGRKTITIVSEQMTDKN